MKTTKRILVLLPMVLGSIYTYAYTSILGDSAKKFYENDFKTLFGYLAGAIILAGGLGAIGTVLVSTDENKKKAILWGIVWSVVILIAVAAIATWAIAGNNF